VRLFDTHCHLGLDAEGRGNLDEDRRSRDLALQCHVEEIVVVGIDLASSRRARDLARALPATRWSAGLHPNSAECFEAEWPELEQLAGESDCCAIGESGLDYYRDRASKEAQARSLAAHRQLAADLDLPLILHCRDALPEMFAQLQAHAPIRGVVHCFSGSPEQALQAVELGLYVSFAGPLTYPRNEELRRAACVVPADRLLIETDAPFLPPQGFRGKPNHPALVVHTAKTLAEVRGWTLPECAEQTYANAQQLFGEAVRT
jgi:TatD DNase family protein